MHERNCVCMFLSLKVTDIFRMQHMHMYSIVTVLKSKYDNDPKNA